MDRVYEKFEAAYLSWVSCRRYHEEIDREEANRLLGKVDELRVAYLNGKKGGEKEMTELKDQIEKAKFELELAENQYRHASERYQDAAWHRLTAAQLRLNALIKEYKEVCYETT